MNTSIKTIAEQTFELLEATGLNWSVNKEQLVSLNGFKSTESYGIFRNDSEAWLGTVGKQYTPFQNSELAETIVEATETLELHNRRGGSLYGGQKIYLQAELPETFIGKSGVKRWATALNSHDGSSSIGFGSSSTVVVCENTFYRAYGDVRKIRHTTNLKARVEAAVESLKSLLKMDNKLMDNFKRMADIQLQDEMVERVIRKIFEVEPNQKQSEISTRKKNQLNAFATALKTEIQLEGATVWGLFNGVTRYTNHVIKHTNAAEKSEYLMNGSGYDISNMAYEELLSFIEANTVEYHTVSR